MITSAIPIVPLLFLAQAPAPSGSSSFMPLLVQFGLIIAIMYFIMLRPQQKQKKQHEEALRALKRGDEVVTAGGIVGEIVHIRETSKDGGGKPADDRITIRSGESKLVVERGRIARVITASPAAASSAPEK
jgi:preprotein translocase subunit YajC